MLKAIIIFSVCSLVNVMLNTIKTIIMYKNEKWSSAIINAITFGFYVVLVVLMAGDMALWLKVVLTAGTNIVGVLLSMEILNRLRKDQLWEVRATVRDNEAISVNRALQGANIPFTCIPCSDNHSVFNIYCATQKDSAAVREILRLYGAKYFVSESKIL